MRALIDALKLTTNAFIERVFLASLAIIELRS